MIYPMANVLYYLGAGASANALPTVNEMTERLGLFACGLDNCCQVLSQRTGGFSIDKIRTVNGVDSLRNFIKELKKRRSIDTYAKELYIKGKEAEIKQLKKILYFYLNWEEILTDDDLDKNYSEFGGQTISEYIALGSGIRIADYSNNIFKEYQDNFVELLKKEIHGDKDILPSAKLKRQRPDQRYVNFLTDILMFSSAGPTFPSDKMKIVSWNYDGQFERACNKLNLDDDFFDNSIAPHLQKLNGSCYNKDFMPYAENPDYEQTMKTLMDKFILSEADTLSESIKFAWENANPNYDEFLKEFDNLEAKHIVVIGYSFPFANREIDKLILKKIIRGWDEDLNNRRYYRPAINIYIQAGSEKDYEDIKERMISLASIDIGAANIKITRVEDLDNFFIPNAL